MEGYTVYVLALPSGGAVRVRKASVLARAGTGALVGFPLLYAAQDPDAESAEVDGSARLSALAGVVDACLLDGVQASDLPIADQLSIARWGLISEPAGALVEGDRPWGADDFVGLVSGDMALLVDAAARRYGTRPSHLLGLPLHEVAVDLDLALAYRGLRQERAGADDEVEVEDVWGEKHRVPRRMLAANGTVEEGARIVKAEDYARAYGPVALSAGGVAGDGRIGPMPVGGQRPW